MYLTHFGRLEQPGNHVETLRASVRGMAKLAIAEEGRANGDRHRRLRDAVAGFLTQSAQRHAPGIGSAPIRDLLHVDIELNAQGLEVWLQRRAKAADARNG